MRCVSHCCACGSHFSGDRAFDAHRTGSHRDGTRTCLDPIDARDANGKSMFTARTEAGRCTVRGQDVDGITVWTKAAGPAERERLAAIRERASDAPRSFSPRTRTPRTEKSDPTPIGPQARP